MQLRSAFGTCLLSALTIVDLPAQPARSSSAATWDATAPRGRTRLIEFTTSEGTWTSVDLSSDGSWIAFDLLGHIYRMPAAGGDAVALTQNSGIASNFHPRISPDGKSIAFISDRAGGDYNLWVMDADGGNAHAVAIAPKTRMHYPHWTPDNQYIVVAQDNDEPRALVMYHRDGGEGITLLKGVEGRMPFRSSLSADGRYLYYDVYAKNNAPEGQADVLKGAVQVHRYDMHTGTVRAITAGEAGQQSRSSSGGAFAAEPSPDGRSLAFIRKVPGGTLEYKGQQFGPRGALWIRDLRVGTERLLMDPVEMDLSESWPIEGSYPMYRWAADGQSIVIHQGGKIRRMNVATGAVTTIPFTVRVRRTISEQAVTKRRITDTSVDVRFIRWASASPDGRMLAFQALGRIYVQSLPSGNARRLTAASFDAMEFQPAWSPDSRTIAFTTVDSLNRGALWRVAATGGVPQRITTGTGEYLNPSWTPDGREIVVARGSGATARAQAIARNPYWEVVRIPATGGDETEIGERRRVGNRSIELRPMVGNDSRVYWATPNDFGSGEQFGIDPRGVEFASVRMDGSDRRVHASIRDADDAVLSPDGKWLAFMQGANVYLAPVPAGMTGASVPKITKEGGDLPVTTLSTGGGLYPRWRTSTIVDFAGGNQFYSHNVVTRTTDSITVKLSVPRAIPSGSIALTGARIVTLDRKRIIENGTVVVMAGRISCVGTCSTTGIEKVVDVAGKTVIPGWVDVHAHLHADHMGLMPRQNFATAVYLAYGITTTHDPATTSIQAFPTAEMIEAGETVGPRVFSTAEALYVGDAGLINGITSRDAAVREVARRQSWGAAMIKQYMQPTRQQRQWVADAARERGMRLTAEASDGMEYALGMVMDGYTGGEHMMVQAPFYSDLTTFLGTAKYFYSHTPLIFGFGAWNEEWFWQESPVWHDPKQAQWIPWRQLIPHTRRFITRPETDYSKDIVAQGIADIIAAGGYSAIGAHGQQPGLGSHWDVWMAAKATGNHVALEIASMHGAMFLGMDDDIGSITVGKLADLMVLNANPLENIRNTADIRYVMKGGTLYDASSLDELWPRQKPYGNSYWFVPEMFTRDRKRVDVYDKK